MRWCGEEAGVRWLGMGILGGHRSSSEAWNWHAGTKASVRSSAPGAQEIPLLNSPHILPEGKQVWVHSPYTLAPGVQKGRRCKWGAAAGAFSKKVAIWRGGPGKAWTMIGTSRCVPS